LLGYLKPYWLHVLCAQVCIAVTTGLNLLFPWLLKDIFDSIITRKDMGALYLFVIALIVLYLVRVGFSFGRAYLLAYIGQHIMSALRIQVFQKTQELSLGFFAANKTGDIISRMTGDIDLLQGTLTRGVADLLQQVLTLVVGTILLLYLDTQLGLVCFAVLPVILLAGKRLGQRLREISRRVRQQLGQLTSFIQEALSGIQIVKSYVMEPRLIKSFTSQITNVLNDSLAGARTGAAIRSLIELLNEVTLVVILGYGGYRTIHGTLSPGELIAFILYVEMVTGPVAGLTDIYTEAQRAVAAAERVFRLIDMQPQIHIENPVRIDGVRGEIRFCNVSFGYHGLLPLNMDRSDTYGSSQDVLNDVSFIVEPGQMVALVGPSGAGKSTIAKLLMRFYVPDSGEIFIDGYPVSTISTSDLRKHIGIVPQDTFLFGTSVKENIACGNPDASIEEIVAAAKAANAHQFIIDLEQGYDTIVGERGVRLSGGQKQRLAIARAILKNPRILILDEATSFLDATTEMMVSQALSRLMHGRSTLIIAHRLSTIKRADKIIYIEDGRIMEQGTHECLLARGGKYSHLWQTQFGALQESG